jgi:hypothetical protein
MILSRASAEEETVLFLGRIFNFLRGGQEAIVVINLSSSDGEQLRIFCFNMGTSKQIGSIFVNKQIETVSLWYSLLFNG